MTFKSESLTWPEQLKTLESLPIAARAQQKEALNVNDTQLTSLKAIKAGFDDKAIERVRLSAQGGAGVEPYILSFSNAQALCRLKQKVKADDLPAAVHTALDVIIPRRLGTAQIKALVEWMVKGNPAETFNPSEIGKKTRTDKRTTDKSQTQAGTLSSELKKIMEVAVTADAEIAKGDGQTAAQDELKALVENMIDKAKKEGDSGNKEEKQKSKSTSQKNPSLIWEWMLGVKFMSQLRSKAKKGELTTTDKLLIIADKLLVKPASWVLENCGKLLKKMAKGFWHSLEEAAGKTVKRILEVVLPLLIICALAWALLAFFHFAVISPLHWAESKISSVWHGEGSNIPEVTPVPSTAPSTAGISTLMGSQESRTKTFNSKLRTTHSAPVVAYRPSVSFKTTDFDPKLLEQEIAAIPANSVIRDYVFQPDEGMPADLAFSRFQDLTDADKYTMMIGSGKVKILSVTPSGTNFIIAYKSTDLFGLLGSSSGTMNIFLEDIKYIHINEIDHFSKPGAQPDINANGNSGPLAQSNPAPQLAASTQMYQCTVVAKGAKFPLTIQCASTDDLENLVSTLEYFIRHSRLARDAQPAGLPYPTQGLRLTSDCVVEKLWANSPADKAGLQPGDMIWSVDKNAADPPNRKKLEAQLAALTAGSHSLFVSSHADWEKAQSDVSFNRASSLNPKRRKVSLQL